METTVGVVPRCYMEGLLQCRGMVCEMFFEPYIFEKGAPVAISPSATAEGEGFARETVCKCIAEHAEIGGGVCRIRFEESLPNEASVSGDEAYALRVSESEAVLYGETERARIYAAVTLLQLCEHGELCVCYIEDEPDCAFRGYRVYLPGRSSFDAFFDMVDTVAYYKYNCIFFEVGGAMEYKRHPEINESWKAFAEDTHRYSGRTHEIQNGYGWRKNSIHTDNGEGDILTQDEVRMLIDYCRARGLEVYPEVPTLSHCDYICLAHPEIREREADPYPDTYCPNHPDTYKIVFDILEEVIEVFRPKLINIGHDEYYSMAICPRCKDTRPDDLFAADIHRIRDFLAEKGIRTAMWGEKLLPVISPNGRPYGGSESYLHPEWYFPALYTCQSKLPRDVLMFNWYFTFGMQYDFVYHTHGYEMVFGNMEADNVKLWRERRKYGAKGGFCSNWGSNHPEYMQRNGQYFRLMFGAFALWSKTYDDCRRSEIMRRTFEEAYRRHFGDVGEGKYITVTHTTDKSMKFQSFYDGRFIEDDVYRMGEYRVTYDDGSVAALEVKYGTNISSRDIPIALEGDAADFDPITMAGTASALIETSYSTIPESIDGKTWYTTAYPNPHPDKKIVSVEYHPETDDSVELRCVRY